MVKIHSVSCKLDYPLSSILGRKINIGLWKACDRQTKDGDFDCRDYSSDKSPYNGKTLVFCNVGKLTRIQNAPS